MSPSSLTCKKLILSYIRAPLGILMRLAFTILFSVIICKAQQPATIINVDTIHFNIPGEIEINDWKQYNPTEPYPTPADFYYGFDKADTILLSLACLNKEGKQNLEILQYPEGKVIYTARLFNTMDYVKVHIPEKSVYKFIFTSNYKYSKKCTFIIRRAPSAHNWNFITKVKWENKKVYFTGPGKNIEKVNEYNAVKIFAQNLPLNRTTKSIDDNSRILIPFNLPAYTIKLIYRITPRKEESTKDLLLQKGLQDLLQPSGLPPNYQTFLPLTKGNATCNVLLIDEESTEKFMNRDTHAWLSEGSGININGGLIQVEKAEHLLKERMYLGLENTSPGNIYIDVEIVAITMQTQYYRYSYEPTLQQ